MKSLLLFVSMITALFGFSEVVHAEVWSTPEALRAFGKPGDTVGQSVNTKSKKSTAGKRHKKNKGINTACVDCKYLLGRMNPDVFAFVDCSNVVVLTNTRIPSNIGITNTEETKDQGKSDGKTIAAINDLGPVASGLDKFNQLAGTSMAMPQ